MGDICEIDADGYLSVTGRTSDFILRGGKNISAAQVEDAVMSHPAIAVAAAVPMRDEVFGEKVCVYVELVGGRTVDLPGLAEHLLGLGVSKGCCPSAWSCSRSYPARRAGRSPKAGCGNSADILLIRSPRRPGTGRRG